MIERMGDTVGILWAAVLAAGAACIRMFYSHGGRLCALEQEAKDVRRERSEIRDCMQQTARDIGEIKVTLGIRGINGKRRKGR